MSDKTLQDVQAYYDRLAERLYSVEKRNWHLQSRMALNLHTIDHFGPPTGGDRRPRVLDIGCGTGFLLEQLAERGYQGIGIDLSPESVAIATSRLQEIGAGDRLTAMVGSAYEPPDGPFDLITLTDVLEHLEDPGQCLRALATQLAPDGLLVISTPNRHSLPGVRRKVAERFPKLRIKLSLAPVDNWQTWGDLEALASQAGLTTVSRGGIFFRPGGRVGSLVGRLYRIPAVRRAEFRLSRTRYGRFGFYISLGFRHGA